MSADKKALHIINSTIFTVLLAVLIFSVSISGRIIAAILLLPLTFLTLFFIKKRSILSINKKEVLLLLSVIAAVYLVLYYLTGLAFGFYKSVYGLKLDVALRFIIPISAIIVTTELIRSVIRAQDNRFADVLCYVSCVIAELLIHSDISDIHSFNTFMEFAGLAFFPAIISNLLYHYLSKRYGPYPNIVYRLITTLYLYIIPYLPAMSNALFAFLNLIVPILVYEFIDVLYEKKRPKAAAKKNSKISLAVSVLALALMTSVILLISNHFRFGALVIATDSMTGELNRGDVCIFEAYDGQIITEGEVIVFDKDGVSVIHRVIKIERINGANRYYTKGDINPDADPGFVGDGEIKGIALSKLPYAGYPTVWIREFITGLTNNSQK